MQTPLEQGANGAQYTGSAIAVFIAWMADHQDFLTSFAMLTGALIGIAGFLVNTYFQWRRTRALENGAKKR